MMFETAAYAFWSSPLWPSRTLPWGSGKKDKEKKTGAKKKVKLRHSVTDDFRDAPNTYVIPVISRGVESVLLPRDEAA